MATHHNMGDQASNREGCRGELAPICFHIGDGKFIEREWPAVPRVGETVMLEAGAFIVAEVHWEDDVIGLPYVHIHLEPRPQKG